MEDRQWKRERHGRGEDRKKYREKSSSIAPSYFAVHFACQASNERCANATICSLRLLKRGQLETQDEGEVGRRYIATEVIESTGFYCPSCRHALRCPLYR